jgi:outer membrane protein TolC
VDLFHSGSFQGQIQPTFTWPLLNYGRLLGAVREKEADFNATVLDYQNTVLKADQEAENGLVLFLKSQQRARDLKTSADAELKAVRDAIAQYKGGLVDFNRVALIQERLVQRQELLAEAQGDIALGLIQVYRALGGGWQIRCGPPLASPVLPPPAVVPEEEEALPQPRPVPNKLPEGAARATELPPVATQTPPQLPAK